MKPRARTLTEQELEIMKVVWERGTATVRDVYETLRERKAVAYTTVMTMMNILEGKGHLAKRPEGRAFVYEPVQEQTQVISGMLHEFVDRVFDGAARPLVLKLIQDQALSKQDLEEIARLIEDASDEASGEGAPEP